MTIKYNIPKHLDDAISKLDDFFPDEEKKFITSNPESEMIQYHSTTGRWIRNNWGLWGDGKLKEWFMEKGISHPDDMSGIILTSYWRWKNDRPLNLDAQIKYYQDYWKKANAGIFY